MFVEDGQQGRVVSVVELFVAWVAWHLASPRMCVVSFYMVRTVHLPSFLPLRGCFVRLCCSTWVPSRTTLRATYIQHVCSQYLSTEHGMVDRMFLLCCCK